MTEKIESIVVQFDNETSAMYGSEEPIGIDTDASQDKFVNMLLNELVEEYPNTDITVKANTNSHIWVNGLLGHNEVPWIEDILHKVWSGFKWIVEKGI